MSILLTGFGPFPGVPRNPSQLIVEQFSNTLAGRSLHKAVLPTVYEVAGSTIESLLRETRPDICLCLGVANDDFMRLETVARNHGTVEKPDESGAVRPGPVAKDGPDTYSCTLPFASIHTALERSGIAAELSDDAGGYVCNHVFYTARHAIERHGLATACGFLHIPPIRSADREDEAIDALGGAVQTVLELLVDGIVPTRRPAIRH